MQRCLDCDPARYSVFTSLCAAAGIVPYINASIVLQLLATSFPSLKRLQRDEGTQGRETFKQYQKFAGEHAPSLGVPLHKWDCSIDAGHTVLGQTKQSLPRRPASASGQGSSDVC